MYVDRFTGRLLLDSGEAKIAKMVKLLLSLLLIAPAAAFLSTSHTFGSLTQVIFIQLTPKTLY